MGVFGISKYLHTKSLCVAHGEKPSLRWSIPGDITRPRVQRQRHWQRHGKEAVAAAGLTQPMQRPAARTVCRRLLVAGRAIPPPPERRLAPRLSVVGTSNMVDAGHLLSSGSGVLARARQGADVTSPQYKSWVLSV